MKFEQEDPYVMPLTYYDCEECCIADHNCTLLQGVIEIMPIIFSPVFIQIGTEIVKELSVRIYWVTMNFVNIGRMKAVGYFSSEIK